MRRQLQAARTAAHYLRAAVATLHRARWLLLPLCLALASGCGGPPISARREGREKVFREITSSALTRDTPSDATVRVLARNDLITLFAEDPAKTLEELHARVKADADREGVLALAELAFIVGHENSSKKHYLTSAVYAYTYLFHPLTRGSSEPFDPHFRLACDIYECALAEFLADDSGDIVFQDGVYDLTFGKLRIRTSRPGFPWGPEEFRTFVSALDYSVKGLWSRNWIHGLGVPLIGVRTPPPNDKIPEERHVASDYLAPQLRVPATAFLRMNDMKPGADGIHDASLELYAPFNQSEIEVEGQRIPLEADLTSPTALSLGKSRLWSFETQGLLSGESSGYPPGIFFHLPYSPGKIPVVFVHGTASSPARWAQLFDALNGYPALRDKFQFWFFIYNTGNPILYSAHLLRERLEEAVRVLDPEGKDPALKQMVLIGHSQGGLLVKLQVVDSGRTFWDMAAGGKMDSLELTDHERDFLNCLLIFKPSPNIRRVVFISTPHRGSFLAARWGSRFLRWFMTPATAVTGMVKKVAERNTEEGLSQAVSGKILTSIDNMEPGNKWIQSLLGLNIDPTVKSHSIIAVDGDGPLEEANDGVVEYTSAHLDGVESEYIVHFTHSCQACPVTVLEVRRILLEQLHQTGPDLPAATASDASKH